jgi:hypothetical protein
MYMVLGYGINNGIKKENNNLYLFLSHHIFDTKYILLIMDATCLCNVEVRTQDKVEGLLCSFMTFFKNILPLFHIL